MRDILFRGKYEPFNKWYYGHYECSYGKHYIIHKEEVQATLDDDIHIVEIKDLIIPESVGQFTGLKDKNGVMIFEGDIILIKNKNCYDAYGTIIYNGSRFMVKEDFGETVDSTLDSIVDGYENEVYVIGNIFDNQELLKEDN